MRAFSLWLCALGVASTWIFAGQQALSDTNIRPMANPISGEWKQINRVKRDLPAVIDSIWFESEKSSLIHIQTSKGEAPIPPEKMRAWHNLMNASTSFYGEPKHPNVAQFFANEIYIQPKAYDKMVFPYLLKGLETGKTVETPYIWQLPAAKRNPHLFYHAQLTPRLVVVSTGRKVHYAEEYVPLRKTRNEYLQAGKSEIYILEVQTKRDAIDVAVERAEFPENLKSSRFRYCVVMLAKNGFSRPERVHVWLASPLTSGIDCDTILGGFGVRK